MDQFIHGILVSDSLIIAIGAQNAFVLKQGLLKQHTFLIASICFLCDAILMTAGILGLGSLISQNTIISIILACIGGLFLFLYGLKAFYNAYHGQSQMILDQKSSQHSPYKIALLTLSITLLNPHVYLDTVVIIGSIAGTLALVDKIYFLLGAISASAMWFFSLAYGAGLLLPLFKKSATWQILDSCIGLIMWFIAFHLFYYAYQHL